MRVEFNKSGAERKALVTAIGEILGTKPKYMGMPTAAYDFGGLILDKNGGAEFEENVFPKDIADLLQKLADKGFTAGNSEELEQVEEIGEEPEETAQGENVGLTVAIPLEKVGVGNLTNLLDAKRYLIKKALGVEDIRIEIDEEKVSFPWFLELPDADTSRAYQNFIAALCKMSKEQKRINATEKPVDNEKYAFRCFLLRLGFIGAEYKADRKILLKRMRFPSKEIVEQLRKEYPAGTRVELTRMDDVQAPPIGTKGTVKGVDDTASIMVAWDNGSGLNVVYGEDSCRKLDAVIVTCYGDTKVWDSRKDAIEFYLRAMAGSEGSEHERYSKIYVELSLGMPTATDEE